MRDVSDLAERRYIARGELKGIDYAIERRRQELARLGLPGQNDSRLMMLEALQSSLIGEIQALSELIRTQTGQRDRREETERMMRYNGNRYSGEDI